MLLWICAIFVVIDLVWKGNVGTNYNMLLMCCQQQQPTTFKDLMGETQ